MPGGNIAETADDAVAYCTDHIRAIPNTGNTPKGFIKSRHIVKNNKKKWVQVTGRIDRDKYSLSRFDRGGQIDAMIRADANCVGYKYFVQLMEPDVEHYCLRCCQRKSDCPINKPNKGCRAVIPGDYT
ncbi:hypothetical protein BGZ65_000195 [Modicella reniformis]|uniref:Uncharacterized protein n=1 Tax=Modicella reniformis TaxID=1440133 RepID=A0A9P6M0F9_9FUNG|nr:hypothetical protein BGZ65_000195 [Modicella reniformis]